MTHAELEPISPIFLSVPREVSDGGEREDALAELRALRQLQEFSALLVHENLDGEIYQHTLSTAVAIMGADMASMQMLDTNEGYLRLLAWRGFHPESAAHWDKVAVGSATSCGTASARAERVIVADVETCGALAGTADLREFQRSGIRSCQSTPLVSRAGNLLGMVSTHWREPHQPRERDLRLLDLLARQAADLIERSQARQALLASEERYRSIIDSSPDCIKVLDPEGNLLALEAGLDLLGLTDAAPLLGKSWIEFWEGEEDRSAAVAAVAAAAAGGEGHFVGFFRTQNGLDKWWDVAVTPVLDARGQPAQLLAVSRDVTERHELEQMLAARAAELAKADRSKDEFLAMLAHELRNPLASLRNASEILQDPGMNADEHVGAQRIIGRQIENMSRMIDDLLDVSRITEGKIELRTKPVSLEAILTAATSLARSGCAKRRQELTVSMPAQPVFLNADATRLEQVFSNLLTNACKYSGDGCHIALSAERAGTEVIVRVLDNGAGIAPELLPRIFDLFVQSSRALDRAHGGLGIGLTLVQRLVELHGGSIVALSEGLGKGTEFIVRLPMLAEAPSIPPLPPPPAKLAISRRILIVDDNTDSARSLATLQGRRGHVARTAFTGPEALNVAAEFLPEVVLLDIGLPGMDGFAVARQIRAMPAIDSTLLVAMTGYATDEDRAQCRAAGFDEHLVKPVDLNLLREWLAIHPRLKTAH